MKRLFCILLAALLLTGTAAASTVFLPPVPASDAANGLETLYFALNIDEEASCVESTLLLKNPTDADITAEMTLPMGSVSAKDDALQLYLDSEPALLTDGCFSVTVPANGCKTVEYRYHAADDLRNVKVISFDFSQLVFTEGAKIGKFEMDVHLAEEDIPLVTDIQPVNYRYQDRTVSIVLYDFAPSVLLDRAMLAKDTWKDLAASREFEPNAEQRYFLQNYRQWFKEGLPVGTDAYIVYDYNVMRGKDPDDWENFYEGGYYDLQEHTDGFVHAATYLYEKARKAASNETEADPGLGYNPEAPLLLVESLCSEAQRELCGTVVCVEFADNPALEGHTLFVTKTADIWWDEDDVWHQETEEIPLTQQQALTTGLSFSRTYSGLPCFSHIAIIPSELSAPPEEVAAFADTVGAAYFIRQMLYDGTVTPYPTTTYSGSYYDAAGNLIEQTTQVPFQTVIGYCGEENKPIANASTMISEWQGEDYRLLPVSDPVLPLLDIPAVVLYRGYVHAEDGKEYVEFVAGHYLEYSAGVGRVQAVTETERGQELLSAAQARRSEQVSKIDAQIGTALASAKQGQPETDNTVPTQETEVISTQIPVEAPSIPKRNEKRIVTAWIAAAAAGLLAAAGLIFIKKKRKGSETK